MKVLVTGGAGFLGSHLCAALLSKGHDVICVDNLGSGKKENIAGLTDNPRFSYVQQDVTQDLNVTEKLDLVCHLASRASPVDFKTHPVEIALTNSLGTLNMIKLAQKSSCPILFASTSEVYGDPMEHPQKETYWGNVNPNGERSCYDESKRFSEALLFAYKRQHGLQIRVVRIFNTYGPHMRPSDGRVVTNFVRQALKNEPITIYGTGKQTRSFCYVDDLINGIMLMIEKGVIGPINLGNPTENTMLELAETVKRLAGSRSEIVFMPLPKDDPARRNPDISLARQELGWGPRISLEEGLAKTIGWLKTQL